MTSPATVVLVGANLAHLAVIRQAGRFRAAGVELKLMAADPVWFFPTLAPEVLSGYTSLQQFRIPVGEWASRCGAEFLHDEVVSIMPQQNKIMTAAGRILKYDAASLALDELQAKTEGTVPVEGRFSVWPSRNALMIRNELETLLELFPAKHLDVVVLGGDEAGVEYALHSAALMEARQPAGGWTLHLLEAKARILPDWPASASEAALRLLRVCNVQVRTRIEVQHIQSHRLVLPRGETLPFDVALETAHPPLPKWVYQAGFAAEGNGLRIKNTLNLEGYPTLFATGHAARWLNHPGCPVSGKTEETAPVLIYNLLAACRQRPLRAYRSSFWRPRFLSLGPQYGLGRLGPWTAYSPWLLKLKHRVERRQLKRFALPK